VPIDDFKFLTRIHYKSPSDGKWGEHESKLARSRTRGPGCSSSFVSNWLWQGDG
jgi:hypothetical protein